MFTKSDQQGLVMALNRSTVHLESRANFESKTDDDSDGENVGFSHAVLVTN